MNLFRGLPARSKARVQQVLYNLVLVTLDDVSDPLVPDGEEAAAVSDGGVTESARDTQLPEVCQLLLDDVHPPSHIPSSAVHRRPRHAIYVRTKCSTSEK